MCIQQAYATIRFDFIYMPSRDELKISSGPFNCDINMAKNNEIRILFRKIITECVLNSIVTQWFLRLLTMVNDHWSLNENTASNCDIY